MTDYTAGVNWYLNPRTKFQFNYIYADLNTDGQTVAGPAGPTRVPLPVGTRGDSHADVFAVRAQLVF